MNRCSRCGFPHYSYSLECVKCHFPLTQGGTLCASPKTPWIGVHKSDEIRRKALAAFVLGLLMKVYWGGHGPWPVITDPTLVSLRDWLEPLLLNGGIIGYAAGWVLRWL